MKKSLIALAALATVATAAQAQSSVTIYGVVDMGYGSIDNVGTAKNRVSGLQNGGLSTSRLGFRGVEDLGGGLKAKFGLEAEILADTGSQASTPEALFARESSVALEGRFGEVKLGRFNHVSYAFQAKYDPFGGNNIGGDVATGASSLTARLENSIQYSTPKFNGFQAFVQTGTRTQGSTDGVANSAAASVGAKSYGEQAGEFNGNRSNAIGVEYSAGNFEAMANWANMKDSLGQKEKDFSAITVRYNFGFARLTAGYAQTDTDAHGATAGYASPVTASKVKKTFIGANVPVTAALTLNAYAAQIETEAATAAASFKPKVYALGANYSLSKRTTLYVIGAQSSQDGASKQAIVNAGKWSHTTAAGAYTNGAAPDAGQDQTAYMVGIRHTF